MRPNALRLKSWWTLAAVTVLIIVMACGFSFPSGRSTSHWQVSQVLREHLFAARVRVSPVRARRPHNPLRLVVARVPVYEVLYGDPAHEKLVGWIDTLECGHQMRLFNFGLAEPSLGPEQGSKRHRCAQCAAAQMKRPAQSVREEDVSGGIRQDARAATA